MKSLIYRGLALAVFVGLLALSVYLSESAFRQVLDFRLLERIPLSAIAESVGGESQLSGIASPAGELLNAPRTGTGSIYYRYLLEREERDSDGDKFWRTVRDETRSSDFYLADDSGRAFVEARSMEWRIRWSIARKYRREIGDYRHTEWRIDPGDRLTVFGWFDYRENEQDKQRGEPVIEFSSYGQYLPIISSFTGSEERGDLAFEAVIRLWGGVTGLIAACYALIYSLKIHRTLVFLLITSVSGSLMLAHYGYRSANEDVTQGVERVEEHASRARKLINEVFVNRNLLPIGFESPFDLNSLVYTELSDEEKSQVNAWRLSAYQVRERYLQQISRFPESYIAVAKRATNPSVVSLPADQLEIYRQDNFESTRTGVSTLWSLLLLAGTAGAAWFAFRAIRTKRMQENIPTSKTAGVVFGLAEVKGLLVPEDKNKLLKGPVSGYGCTWYRYLVEERRGSGKNKSWHTVSDDIRKQPFFCEDEEGRIRIFPGHSECITKHVEKDHRGDMRYTEWRLSPGDELYVMGKARLDKTRGDSLVFGHEKGSPYIIANIPEEDVMMRKARTGMGLLAMALSLLFFGALLISGSNGDLSSLDFVLASLIAPVFMLFVVFVLMYNDLVFLRQRCDRNWANIQVSLNKRADLIPQLEQVVKQYLSHESQLQKELVRLRELRQEVANARDFDEYISTEHETINQLSARIEQYPDLEGIDLIAVFNRRLIKLENEVALIRAGFNDAVTEYEIRSQSFPDNILARLFRFPAVELLRYDLHAHSVPAVSVKS
jgi:hypothetical protein